MAQDPQQLRLSWDTPERPETAADRVLLSLRQGYLQHNGKAVLARGLSASTDSACCPPCSTGLSRSSDRPLVRIALAGLAVAFALAGRATRAAASPAGRVTLRGTVLDQYRRPVEGAEVSLCIEGKPAGVVFENGLTRCKDEIASTRAGRSGGFRLRLPHDVASLPTILIVGNSEYLTQTIPVATVGMGTPAKPFEIILRPCPSVHGTVVDAEGQPVSKPGLGWFVEDFRTPGRRPQSLAPIREQQ